MPPGLPIDGSQIDRWTFPAGTHFFKEFRFEKKAETRMIELLSDGSSRPLKELGLTFDRSIDDSRSYQKMRGSVLLESRMFRLPDQPHSLRAHPGDANSSVSAVRIAQHFDDEELGAIHAYLKTVPAVENRVPAPIPPTSSTTM